MWEEGVAASEGSGQAVHWCGAPPGAGSDAVAAVVQGTASTQLLALVHQARSFGATSGSSSRRNRMDHVSEPLSNVGTRTDKPKMPGHCMRFTMKGPCFVWPLRCVGVRVVRRSSS